MKNYYILYISLLLFTACKPDVDEFEVSSGSANFSRYVAIGNSLTAGFSNGALYISGQQNSFPAILAKQFSLAGGGSFKLPLMVDENGVGIIGTTPVPKRILGSVTDCKGVTSLGPLFVNNGVINPANLTSIKSLGPFNNLGIPGAKSFHLVTPLFAANPFYARIATNPGTSTVIGDAIAQNPTFFTLWIGANDVLSYASSGGEEGNDSITDQTLYAGSLNAILTALTSQGAKGAIANIPDITTIPYFTTVPYNGLVLTNQTDVNNLNTAYNGTGITFQLGQNPFIIADPTKPGGLRQITQDEFVLLTVPQDSIKCKGWGSSKPIPGNYILDASEIAMVKTATDGFNTTITNAASAYGLALVDANTTIKNLKASGLTFDGIKFTATYVTGGAFSLDGIHLTPRGYAIVANKFIEAINVKYSSNIPQVSISQYEGLRFP